MDENWLRVREYNGAGFKSLIEFNDWRVAILNYLENIHPEHNDTMERHIESDEVFVLLKGRGILLIGGNEATTESIFQQALEQGKIYNVMRNTWHTILLSRDASVLLVENRDTSEQNSEYTHLSKDQKDIIGEIANRERLGD